MGVLITTALKEGRSSGIRPLTVAPSNSVTMSPARRPASAAGEPAMTPATNTPRSRPEPRKSGCGSRPVQLRSTKPFLMICSATDRARFAGIAPPRLPRPTSLMPMISPSRFTNGPPLLPPKITASWPIQRTRLPTLSPSSLNSANQYRLGIMSCRLLTMPLVTDCETAIGEPMASTVSPMRARSESPNLATGSLPVFLRRLRSSRITAMSASASVPTSLASISSPSAMRQRRWRALPATW